MPLSSQQKKYFRQLGHSLNPVVTIAGNGLSDSVAAELNRALEDHELLKVKIVVDSRDEKASMIETICKSFEAELVQAIGNVALIYRAAANPDPKLSNLLK